MASILYTILSFTLYLTRDHSRSKIALAWVRFRLFLDGLALWHHTGGSWNWIQGLSLGCLYLIPRCCYDESDGVDFDFFVVEFRVQCHFVILFSFLFIHSQSLYIMFVLPDSVWMSNSYSSFISANAILPSQVLFNPSFNISFTSSRNSIKHETKQETHLENSSMDRLTQSSTSWEIYWRVSMSTPPKNAMSSRVPF